MAAAGWVVLGAAKSLSTAWVPGVRERRAAGFRARSARLGMSVRGEAKMLSRAEERERNCPKFRFKRDAGSMLPSISTLVRGC